MTDIDFADIDFDDLVSTADIANMFKITSGAVSNWKNRHDDFPDPVVSVAKGTTPLYSCRAVVAWYAKRLSPELIQMIKEL